MLERKNTYENAYYKIFEIYYKIPEIDLCCNLHRLKHCKHKLQHIYTAYRHRLWIMKMGTTIRKWHRKHECLCIAM